MIYLTFALLGIRHNLKIKHTGEYVYVICKYYAIFFLKSLILVRVWGILGPMPYGYQGTTVQLLRDVMDVCAKGWRDYKGCLGLWECEYVILIMVII
jgi:hypothetical protein